ncbi:hypothetical protein C8J57DRAFT_1231806 [Mycena rebaudengoi]|nr:hypothetical protein C8J57DRAFT_1231806 [Mycena rebaudengoi]
MRLIDHSPALASSSSSTAPLTPAARMDSAAESAGLFESVRTSPPLSVSTASGSPVRPTAMPAPTHTGTQTRTPTTHAQTHTDNASIITHSDAPANAVFLTRSGSGSSVHGDVYTECGDIWTATAYQHDTRDADTA